MSLRQQRRCIPPKPGWFSAIFEKCFFNHKIGYFWRFVANLAIFKKFWSFLRNLAFWGFFATAISRITGVRFKDHPYITPAKALGG